MQRYRPSTDSPLGHPHVRFALLGYALVLVLATLVHLGLLAGLDAAAMAGKRVVQNPLLDALGAATGVLVSAEFSLAYGLVASLLLWRMGIGVWALAPLAFVLVVPVEFAMKLAVDQPQVPSEFHNPGSYPLTHVSLPGAFPSGHAARTAFFGAFLAVLAYPRGTGAGRWLALVPLLLAVLVAYTRTYVGDHWLSDVVAGFLLGAGTALLVAVPLAGRLASVRRSQTG